jgi:hypothetical protein
MPKAGNHTRPEAEMQPIAVLDVGALFCEIELSIHTSYYDTFFVRTAIPPFSSFFIFLHRLSVSHFHFSLYLRASV